MSCYARKLDGGIQYDFVELVITYSRTSVRKSYVRASYHAYIFDWFLVRGVPS